MKTKLKITAAIAFAFAVLFVGKAFGQEWEWEVSTPENTYSGFQETFELSDGRILAKGIMRDKNFCGGYDSPHPALLVLDSDGTELAYSEYYKDGYFGFAPYILENESGEVYALIAFSPDHDTCSLNYFKNFDPPTDHCILGLYKLNDDLSFAESHELEIPIDTFEWRSPSNTHLSYTCGQAHLYTAFVDDDGSIVGVYSKTVTEDRDSPRGFDSTVFFRLDFDGRLLGRASYCGNFRSGNNPEQTYQHHHIAKADSLYIYYGYLYDVTEEDYNLIYLDRDFNVMRKRYYRHPNVVHPFSEVDFTNMNVKRNRFGKTYVTSSVVETNGSHYCCVLYEFNDDINGTSNNTPVSRYAERKTTDYDFPTYCSSVDLLDDNTIIYAYALNVGMNFDHDSWIVIERLSPEFETISTLFYGLGDERCNTVTGVSATHGGGVLLCSRARSISSSKRSYMISKFPAEAFVGIDEAHDNGLKVAIAYPNPGKDVLNIRTGLKDARVEVYDMNGRMIYGREITENVTAINTSTWPAGSYVWNVVANEKEMETGKWVKK